MDSFETVSGYASAQITEKRSRFIAHVFHVENELEANERIAQIRKEYWDARHNVYAYVLREGSVSRFSDDSEPHGTAGPPVLEAITAAGLCDTLVVVTRYFGGVLLGTGGLVRAYSEAAALGLKEADRRVLALCTVYRASIGYDCYEKLCAAVESCGGSVEKTDFGGSVSLEFCVPTAKTGEILKKTGEILRGRPQPEKMSEKYCLVKK